MTDPRPKVVPYGDDAAVLGARCTDCGYPTAFARPACPVCSGPVVEQHFGPAGTVFASTVVRIPVGDRTPPYALAYVDLDDGPRLLAGTPPAAGSEPAVVPVGSRVRLVGVNEAGDPVVVVQP